MPTGTENQKDKYQKSGPAMIFRNKHNSIQSTNIIYGVTINPSLLLYRTVWRLARRSYMREKNWDFSGACVAATPDTVGFCGRDGSFESGHNSKKNRTYPAIIRIPKIRTNQNSVAFVLTFSIRSTHRFPNLYIKHKPSTSLFSFQVHLFRFFSQVRDGQERTSNGWGWVYRDSHGSSAAQGGLPRVHHRQPW